MDASIDPVKRRAGRPRAFDREAALDQALDRFWRHGFEGVSTAQLCEAMGINPPSLYAAFGSKEALYLACLERYVDQHGRYFRDALAGPGPARQVMERLLLGAAGQFSGAGHAPGCMVANGGLQGGAEHEGLQAALAGQRLAAQQAIAERLARARREGELPAGLDAKTLAAYFSMVIQGLAIQARDGASLKTLQALARLAMQAWPAG